MQYCNKSLIKNNNEILQYFNKNNDIALVMHQRALLDMSGIDYCIFFICIRKFKAFSNAHFLRKKCIFLGKIAYF